MKTEMYFYESMARQEGFNCVCGIDEAGRGPLAGPVYAAAVVLRRGCIIEGVDDSKKLSQKKREYLYDIIMEKAEDVCVASASVEEIDNLNILKATFLAMNRAFCGLNIRPDLALIDGNQDPCLPVASHCIIGGDGKSASIAAASIIAKVSRDRFMSELDKQYPQYLFRQHKGYPTYDHYGAILKFGPSPVHRMTFLKNLEEKRMALEKG